uniref:Uncharacterized protein n=1 Tax=Oryza barthii TaxID=65489 RepID=A0A0D3FMF8_9ORYZ
MVNTMGEKDRAKFTDMNIDGNGLLQVAAHLGKIEVIRYFVEELGFDVNAGCLSDGVTALASAAMFGEAYVVRYLLEHGADPNKTDETGSVALHFAAKNGLSLHGTVFYRRIGVVKILLDHHDESCGKVNDRKAELKSQGEKAVKRNDYLAASKIYSEDESCGKVNDRKAELKSQGEKAVKRNDYLAASKIYSEEHKKAFEAFLNALKLDPANAEIEKVMW